MPFHNKRLVRVTTAAWRAVRPNSTVGLPWRFDGANITFEWGGFVAAPNIPGLFARHHYETRLIRKLLGSLAIERSLEFGCGFGRLTPTLASMSASHVAVDINGAALESARGSYPDLTFLQVDGGALPFPDDHFDLTVTWTVLQHVRPQLIDDVLAELLRVTTAKGVILLCEETRTAKAAEARHRTLAGRRPAHTWHRESDFYAERLTPFELTYASGIGEIDALEGMASPGRVMLFEGRRG